MIYEFDGIDNARDLGGWERADGARIREGVLFRTGHLGNASEEDIKRLSDLHIHCIIDMRDHREREKYPDKRVPGSINCHLPPVPDLQVYIPIQSRVPEEVRKVFHDFYKLIALHPLAKEAYAAFFQKLLQSNGQPILWHCTQGKDRTGAAAMLVMSALGFERSSVIAEYLRTNLFAQKQLAQYREEGASAEDLALMEEVFPVYEKNGEFYLECIEEEYGTVEAYLRSEMGIGPAERKKLEKYYLVPRAGTCLGM